MTIAASWLLVATGAAVAGCSLYLVVLAVAAFRRPPALAEAPPSSRLAVIVPAYNEASLIGRCVESLRCQTYPANLYRIIVIADNCTDSTAGLAQAAGAEVLVRDEPGARGKGRALRWAMDRLLAESPVVDAVAVVDADSVADPDLLRALAATMAAGAEAVQGEYLVATEPGAASQLRQAAFLLFHRTRFRGRLALGMACNLVGNGMLFRTSLLQLVPWDAFSGAEDLEYSLTLRRAGIKPRFAATARVCGPVPGGGRAASAQRLRWEGGRFHMVRTALPGLLRRAVRSRDWSLLDAAADLIVPPLGLLVLLAGLGTGAAVAGATAGVTSWWAAAVWSSALLGAVLFVFVGLIAASAPAAIYRSLLLTPAYLGAKLLAYARLTRGLHADRWERTERPGEGRRPCNRRVDVCGVPIDAVDEAEAAGRVIAAVETGQFLQVATVNLQFLVSARRQPEVRRALSQTGLNVADGAPVVWLCRLLGCPSPGRVAGADLVPAVVQRAAERRARVFLLGGTGGTAAAAAQVLRRNHPDLIISGTYEPPVSRLEGMDSDAIIRLIADAGTDILLVGLGHPKQDLWIAANRERLPVAAAIGVGGTFDLIAGRLRRAPRWAQQSGAEWLFRLAQEPMRLLSRYATCATWLLAVFVPLAAWSRLSRPAGALPFHLLGGDSVEIIGSASAPALAARPTEVTGSAELAPEPAIS